MYATANKKMLNMLILDILEEYSDADHRLTQQEIIRLLKANYDMECDRRSVKNNVEYLNDLLGDVIDMEDGYYLAEREFEDAELRMLIDSVLFSKNLTQKQARSLIDKLRAKGNKYFPAKVSHIRNLPEMQHSDNKQLMYALDTVNDAIAGKKKISFIYNTYGTDFKLHPKRDVEWLGQKENPDKKGWATGKGYGGKILTILKAIVGTKVETPKEEKEVWYRVRKTWSDAASQKGAYHNLEYAKKCADENKGYSVFDEAGNVLYSNTAFEPYLVRVSISDLNIRKGPGTNYGRTKYIPKGTYTIVEESDGKGATKWGKLKSGAGWISLDFVKRI